MTDTIAQLERLAAILETKAAASEAASIAHYQARETHDAEKEKARAENGKHFAQVCRDAARKLKIREKRAAFIPPSLEEAIDHARVKYPAWDRDDVTKWWNHFESVGWIVGGGKAMRNWHNALSNGYHNWLEKHPGKARVATGEAVGDPPGWAAFLKACKRPYKEFKYEQEFLRTQFRKLRAL